MIPKWLKNLKPASFRGVSFEVNSSGTTVGRNKVVHEFSKTNFVFVEDTGKKTDKFSVSGFIIGDDYMNQRDLLITACKKEGSGRLSHPYYGLMRVECLSLSISESKDNGGIASFEAEFVEAGESVSAFAVVDKVLDFANSLDKLLNQAALEFLELFSLLDLPNFVVDSLASSIEDLGSVIAQKNGMNGDSLLEIPDSLERLVTSGKELINSPSGLVQSIRDAQFEDTKISQKNSGSIKSSLNNGENFEKRVPVDTSTESRRREKKNLLAMKRLIDLQTIAISSRVFLEDNDILSPVDEIFSIIEKIDALLIETDTHDTFSLLSDVRAKLFSLSLDLKKTDSIAIQLMEVTPAIVLAYEMFGDISKEDEILRTNDIENPVAIFPGRTNGVVLSDI